MVVILTPIVLMVVGIPGIMTIAKACENQWKKMTCLFGFFRLRKAAYFRGLQYTTPHSRDCDKPL